MDRKKVKKYTFTVEGETERLYFDWLNAQINNCSQSKYKVKIHSKVQQSPLKFAKTVNPLSTPCVTHICDYESNEDEHVKKFEDILFQLNKANNIKNCSFKYKLGYSNFTFELWIVLHKKNCNTVLTSRKQYLTHINQAFDENFASLNQYKKEDNFKKCLSKLSLADVVNAINRAKNIMDEKCQRGCYEQEYMGFHYYKDNPALTIWKNIYEILEECGLLKENKKTRQLSLSL